MCQISNLKLSLPCGIDNINSKVLKHTYLISGQILFHIFKQSLSSGQLPAEWKIVKIIPIFKNGSHQAAENYRLISLTCISYKILEHIISSHLYSHLECNSFFFSNQHGFCRILSCETQILKLTTGLHSIMDDNVQTDGIFLDYSKAFECVAHCPLNAKLSSLGIDSLTLSYNFLSCRLQFTFPNNFSH